MRLCKETQQTQHHCTSAESHLKRNLAVIQPLSHEQAFGLMTYSLICVRCDSQRHSENKALSGKFRRRPSWCRQVTWQYSWAQRRNVTFSLRHFSPGLWQEWRCRVSKMLTLHEDCLINLLSSLNISFPHLWVKKLFYYAYSRGSYAFIGQLGVKRKWGGGRDDDKLLQQRASAEANRWAHRQHLHHWATRMYHKWTTWTQIYA